MTDGTIESLQLRMNGYRAHYLKAGGGPPVVLLHGGASDSRDWLGTMTALASTHSLYAPDLIGYGQSERPKSSYLISDFTEFTLGFMNTLGLDSCALVGHSLGGRVCLDVALRFPERVSKLALINTLGFARITHFGNFLGMAAWVLRKILGRPQPYPALAKQDSENANWTCLEQLPRLIVPTLIVWKRHDPYFPLKSAVNAVRLMPRAKLAVIPGYGHAPHKEKGNLFNHLLLDFLNDNLSTK